MKKKYITDGMDSIIFKTYTEFKKKMKENKKELNKYGKIYIKDKQIYLKENK